ncbi:lipocalin family protein [Flavobacterium sp.]|uniref:lipocalin family protein n=1 Tax=Flavobacterium sp. TaxID=239 RepID=UPI002FDA409C
MSSLKLLSELEKMKKISLLLLALVLISCHSNVKKEDLAKLNGYWEIKQVQLANGETKDYKINETIDYFEVKDNAGFRQKVMPQFDGKYKTNDIKETIKIIAKDNSYFIEYKTKFGKWQEEIIELADSTLVLKNKDKLQYQYKRFTPFSLK